MILEEGDELEEGAFLSLQFNSGIWRCGFFFFLFAFFGFLWDLVSLVVCCGVFYRV